MLTACSFHKVSSFGCLTIHKFSNSISEMKKLAGRDFEDILQCAGPCFEGLFPCSINSQIQDLLFTMASWHAFAKLWLHTNNSLDVFWGLTTAFTWQIRHFASKVCPKFDTVQTPSERATIIHARDAKVQFGPVLQGICPNLEPEPSHEDRKR